MVVSTAQVFLDVLDHAFFNMNNAALLIFDECHHVLGSKHAYRVIMHRYSQLPKSKSLPAVNLNHLFFNSLCQFSSFFFFLVTMVWDSPFDIIFFFLRFYFPKMGEEVVKAWIEIFHFQL